MYVHTSHIVLPSTHTHAPASSCSVASLSKTHATPHKGRNKGFINTRTQQTLLQLCKGTTLCTYISHLIRYLWWWTTRLNGREWKQVWEDYISWCTVDCGGQRWSNETTLPSCQLLQPSSLMSDVPSMRGWTVVASCQVMCWSHDILPYPRCIICTLYIVQYNNGAQYIRT